MASPKNRVSGWLDSLSNWVQLERTYIIFAVIYFPIALLFLDRGNVATWALVIYTVLLFITGIAMIGKFVVYFAASSNDRKGNYGSLFLLFLLDVFIPLSMFKVHGYVLTRALPGVLAKQCYCDFEKMVKAIDFNIMWYTNIIDVLIFASLFALAALALWNVRKVK